MHFVAHRVKRDHFFWQHTVSKVAAVVLLGKNMFPYNSVLSPRIRDTRFTLHGTPLDDPVSKPFSSEIHDVKVYIYSFYNNQTGNKWIISKNCSWKLDVPSVVLAIDSRSSGYFVIRCITKSRHSGIVSRWLKLLSLQLCHMNTHSSCQTCQLLREFHVLSHHTHDFIQHLPRIPNHTTLNRLNSLKKISPVRRLTVDF